jgi:hypothetical protein
VYVCTAVVFSLIETAAGPVMVGGVLSLLALVTA